MNGQHEAEDKRFFDENGLFGDDDDGGDEASSSFDTLLDGKNQNTEGTNADSHFSGDAKLSHVVEQIDSVLNKSIHASIPIVYFATVSSYVVKVTSDVFRDIDGNKDTNKHDDTVQNLLQQCIFAVENRDFASCRIVGSDLEHYLFRLLNSYGSCPDSSFRATYWCASITASIGYANEGSFLVAMKYLDKSVILGQDRQILEGFFSYVEHFSSQMALGPCPPALSCVVPDYCDAKLQELLLSYGLSRALEYPVEEFPQNHSDLKATLFSDHCDAFVIRGLASTWPAVHKWRHMDDLAQEHGHRLIPIEVGFMRNRMKESIVTFREFVTTYLSPSAKKNCWNLSDATTDEYSLIAYLAQHPLLNQVPSLYCDVEKNPCGIQPTNINIWMGTGGTRTPLHYDSYDNLLVQLVGAKYIRLYAEEDKSKLYISSQKGYALQGNMSELDCEMEDFEKHPLAKDCAYQEVLLLPGDCLFIPSRQWHYVRSLSTSVSINYWF
jgi:lysine-specific demethylase 8